MTINPVNWIRYEIRNLASPASSMMTGIAAAPGYAPLYDAGAYTFEGGVGSAYVGDAWKRDLVRVEIDPTSSTRAEFASTLEVVAENAADLRVGLSYVNGFGALPVDPVLAVAAPGDAAVYQIAGDVAGVNTGGPGSSICTSGSTSARPHCIRSVRVRLGLRSREFDRPTNVIGPGGIDGGLVRIAAGPDASAYARVRNLVADVQLPNLAGVTW
jgi:hypothetical protein